MRGSAMPLQRIVPDSLALGSVLLPAVVVVEAVAVLVLLWYVTRLLGKTGRLGREVAKLRIMTENAPSCVFRITETGTLVDVSADVVEVAGWRPEEIVGERFDTIIHPDDVPKVTDDMVEAISSNEIVVRRYRILCKDGRYKWAETLSHQVAPAVFGRPREIVGVCHDISTRIDTQQELAAKDSQLRLVRQKLLEAQRIAGLGYWYYDPKSGMISYEKQTAEALRFPDPSDARRPFSEMIRIVHPDDREYVEAQFHAAVWHAEPFDLVFRVVSQRKRIRYINAVAKVFYDEKGAPTRVMGTAIDLTERVSAQNELRYQRELFANLIENMPVGAYAKSRGRFILWNGAMERLTGKARDEVIGRSDCGLFDEWEREADAKDDEDLIRRDTVRNERDETWTTESGPRDVHVVKVPVVEENGRDVTVFGLVEDVTDKRRMEDRLRQSQKMEAVGQLAGGIAHDFNNILQVVLGYGELLRGHFEEGSQTEDDFNKILDAANRAMTLVTQLLTFSRDDEGKCSRLDLNFLIADLVKMIQRVIGDHVELAFIPKSDLPSFVGDPIQIEQLLMNLCINARDAMPEGGRLRIATEEFAADANWRQLHPRMKTNEFIVISVSDNGMGMSKEIQDRIYEPFFTTKDVGKGTGLGLATVYAIVERHGGVIDVYSERGVGTTFRIYFPRAGRPVEETPVEIADEPAELGGSETILLAEDETTVRALSERTLRGAGYTVLVAKDGREAIELFQTHIDEIDALVFDVVMPRRNGREAYEAIEKARPGMPVLFCSGCSEELLQWEYAPAAGGGILQKPYTRTTLLRTLRGILDQAKGKDEKEVAAESARSEADLRDVTILIAEDASSNRKLFRKALREAGANVIEAVDGLEAIRAVESGPVDLILMDIQMPEVDGYTAAARIRATGFEGPIVALTAHTRQRERKTCEEIGFTAVFSKPVAFQELPRQVAEVWAESEERQKSGGRRQK